MSVSMVCVLCKHLSWAIREASTVPPHYHYLVRGGGNVAMFSAPPPPWHWNHHHPLVNHFWRLSVWASNVVMYCVQISYDIANVYIDHLYTINIKLWHSQWIYSTTLDFTPSQNKIVLTFLVSFSLPALTFFKQNYSWWWTGTIKFKSIVSSAGSLLARWLVSSSLLLLW